jgi:hypothetical protein
MIARVTGVCGAADMVDLLDFRWRILFVVDSKCDMTAVQLLYYIETRTGKRGHNYITYIGLGMIHERL